MTRNRCKLYFLLSLFIYFIYVIIVLINKQYDTLEKFNFLFILLTIFLCSAIVYLSFSSACKTGNFSALAGYSPKKNYNMEVLGEMVEIINGMIQLHTLLFSIIIFVISAFGFMTSYLMSAALLFYIADFVFIILYLNYKYKDKLFKKPNDIN
ncbi:MAG: hypothetical protein FWG91_00415 [Lachnospiraceae bacterium]|nr:hypothetical protein [Lachnospiraceae bacterium]